jgi:hypothetical protein
LYPLASQAGWENDLSIVPVDLTNLKIQSTFSFEIEKLSYR